MQTSLKSHLYFTLQNDWKQTMCASMTNIYKYKLASSELPYFTNKTFADQNE